jgi:hypothetical protein
MKYISFGAGVPVRGKGAHLENISNIQKKIDKSEYVGCSDKAKAP